ncbi:DUF2235 domain-containing protein [Acidipila sp. EB88]|uniref:T6SS phospholipase effector Tle1-like catalytic domain-containing protein n=1 Tax=Acidipila sp. EB88 TaxID=2305226 RepID=UPI000F5EFE44|nr:DUF2235 domain-containing protein [Acidipila sp. EB88]RRA47460.1 DUF2235 domain-containing protein [Acidipila sp. EB88]
MSVENAVGKNIVICCDGTGNQFCETNSNVVRLYTCLKENREQVTYYHPGVGTMGSPHRSTRVGKKLSQLAGLTMAAGFIPNLQDAYLFLMRNYAAGDRVYLFGFSRGAYTVRALTGALSMYGLLCPGNEGHLAYLLQMFSDASRKAYARGRKRLGTDPLAAAFRDTFSREITIHFVGVWDTVSSIGWAYNPVRLLFDGQNPLVRKGRHAISIDEHRCYFQKNPWGDPLPPEETPLLAAQGTRQDIVQAHFAGVHSDVGGSYLQDESAPALDAFQWILEEAQSDGLLTDNGKRDVVLGKPAPGHPDLEVLHASPPPFTRLHESLRGFWWVLEFLPHRYIDERGSHWQLMPLAHRREIANGALLHPSLIARLAGDRAYQPPNLDRCYVHALRDSPVSLPDASLEWELAQKRFGVYRPPTHVRVPSSSLAKILEFAPFASRKRRLRSFAR